MQKIIPRNAIEDLELLIKLHTEWWDDLEISYNQDFRYSDDDCGCALHTLDQYVERLNLSDEYFDKHLNDCERDYIYGYPELIMNSANSLGFKVPKRFQRRDLVSRCKKLLKRYKKANGGNH